MKKILVQIGLLSILGLLLASEKIFADDARVYKIGGSAGNVSGVGDSYQLGQDEDIAMTAEHVLITMYDDFYTVDAKFWLKNEGESKTIAIGFPEHAGELEDFCSFVNGKKVEIAKYADNEAESELDWGASWYVKQVHFQKGQTNITEIKYKSSRYGIVNCGLYFGIDGSLPYIYGTGKSWKGSIGKITVDIKNLSSKRYVTGFYFLQKQYGTYSSDGTSFKPISDAKVSFKWVSSNTFRLEAKDVEPDNAYDYLELELHNFEHQNVEWFLENYLGKTTINARCEFTKDFLKSDLCFFTENQLRLARNDFYALHGRSFKDKELKRFYESIVGYTVNKDYSDNLLSAEEKEIVSKVLEIEQQRKKELK